MSEPEPKRIEADHNVSPWKSWEGARDSTFQMPDGTSYTVPWQNGVAYYSMYGLRNWAEMVLQATNPMYPHAERKTMHEVLISNYELTDDDVRALKCEKNNTGPAGSPSPFACMMHVLGAAGWVFSDKQKAFALIANHKTNWIEQSNSLSKLLKDNPKKLEDINDMFSAYIDQVVLPCVRYHLSPQAISRLGDTDIDNIKRKLKDRLFPEFIRDKTLFDLLELSEKWHTHQAALDKDIRTIAREGDWRPLLEGGTTLHVPDKIAKGWIIRNVTDAKELGDVGRDLHMCIAGKTNYCLQGIYHVFAFYDAEGKPSSTLRVSVNRNSQEGDIAVKGSFGLNIEDRTNSHNVRNFSKADNAAYEWFKESLKKGTIKLQLDNYKSGETDESKAHKTLSPIEWTVGFPVVGDEDKAESRHLYSFEHWAGAGNSVVTSKIPERKPGLPLNRQTLSALGYRRVGPDIGTSKGKYMIPEAYREHSPAYYHFKTGQDKILRGVLAEVLRNKEVLIDPDKHSLSAKLRRENPQTFLGFF